MNDRKHEDEMVKRLEESFSNEFMRRFPGGNAHLGTQIRAIFACVAKALVEREVRPLMIVKNADFSFLDPSERKTYPLDGFVYHDERKAPSVGEAWR